MTTYPIPRGAHAPCEKRPEWHFPPMGSQAPQFVEAAKNVCAGCPFLADCAEWGIRRERFGVWGGLTEDERQVIRSRRGIVPDEPDMARFTAAKPRPRVRADSCALAKCTRCGKEMRPNSIARHWREVHPVMA